MLRKIRIKLGLTQKQLAKELNITQPYLSMLEWEDREIPVKMSRKIIKIAKSYGHDILMDDLYRK